MADIPPDINAFLDNIEATSPPEAPEPTDTPTTAPAPESAAAPPEPADPAAVAPAPSDAPPADATVEQLWKDIKELRRESGGYRVRAKEFEEKYGQAFDGLDQEIADTFLTLPQMWKQDPAAVLEWMREQVADAEQQPAAEGERPFTRAEAERLWAEKEAARQQQQTQEQHVASVWQQVEQLGYRRADDGGQIPPDTTMVMTLAANNFDGDVQKAHEYLTSLRTVAVDEYLAKKAAGADAPAPVPSTGGTGPSAPKITNMKDAAKAADAYLAATGMK